MFCFVFLPTKGLRHPSRSCCSPRAVPSSTGGWRKAGTRGWGFPAHAAEHSSHTAFFPFFFGREEKKTQTQIAEHGAPLSTATCTTTSLAPSSPDEPPARRKPLLTKCQFLNQQLQLGSNKHLPITPGTSPVFPLAVACSRVPGIPADTLGAALACPASLSIFSGFLPGSLPAFPSLAEDPVFLHRLGCLLLFLLIATHSFFCVFFFSSFPRLCLLHPLTTAFSPASPPHGVGGGAPGRAPPPRGQVEKYLCVWHPGAVLTPQRCPARGGCSTAIFSWPPWGCLLPASRTSGLLYPLCCPAVLQCFGGLVFGGFISQLGAPTLCQHHVHCPCSQPPPKPPQGMEELPEGAWKRAGAVHGAVHGAEPPLPPSSPLTRIQKARHNYELLLRTR